MTAPMTHPLTPREKVAALKTNDPTNPAHRLARDLQAGHFAPGESRDDLIEVLSNLPRFTTLASGSGDHAPVAWRVKDFADGWIVCGSEQTAIDLATAMSGATVQALYEPAILAENAALRSVVTDQAALHLNMMRGGVPKLAPANIGHLYRGEEAKEVIAEVDRQNPGSNTRATEAEAELREHRITADLLVSTLKADKEEAERKLAEAVGIASKLSTAISWLDYPFIDNNTSEDELRLRVGFMMKDAEQPRAMLSEEAERG